MDNSGTGLLIFLLGDPHSLEGGQGTEDGASDPHQELPLCGGDDLDLHGGRSQGSDFFAETFRDTRVHGGSTTHDDIAIQIFSDVDVALEDGLVADLVEAGHLFTDHHGLEEGFRASEPLGRHSDDLAVGQLVSFIILG